MKAVHLLISGRVQGVGYRDWLVAEAQRCGVAGWVRNLGASQVEAVLSGADAHVETLARLCETGPRHAAVTHVQITPATEPAEGNFRRLASA